MHVPSEVTPPPLPLNAAEPGRAHKEQYQEQKFHPHPPVLTQRHSVCSHTPTPPDVLSAKLTHERPYLVVGDPPSAGDNTSIPGSAVTQGHRACLCQGSWRDWFTYKVTPNTSVNVIHTQQIKLSNFHRGPGRDNTAWLSLKVAALPSSPTETETSCATAPSSAQLHEGAVTVLFTTQGQLPPPPSQKGLHSRSVTRSIPPC